MTAKAVIHRWRNEDKCRHEDLWYKFTSFCILSLLTSGVNSWSINRVYILTCEQAQKEQNSGRRTQKVAQCLAVTQCFGWSRRCRHNQPPTQASSRSPPLLGLSNPFFLLVSHKNVAVDKIVSILRNSLISEFCFLDFVAVSLTSSKNQCSGKTFIWFLLQRGLVVE